MNLKIGKATVEINVLGCIQCGTRGSSGWTIAKILTVKIGKREHSIPIYICSDCQKEGKYQEILL